MKTLPKKQMLYYLTGLGIFIAGLVLGMYITNLWENKKISATLSSIKPIRDEGDDFEFISPLLGYDIPAAEEPSKLNTLGDNIKKYIQDQKNNNKISRASVYVKRLNSSRWIIINENEQYTPASLFKVPLLIAYLKTTETTPEVLNHTLTQVDDIDENKGELISPTNFIKPGTPYKISELLNYMIKDSDNNAARLLFNAADKNFFEKIFSDLNVPLPKSDQEQDFIGVKDFAFFFRILYNGTYLERQTSEQALQILSQTTFTDGLMAGVPKDIAVAHKFGEYDLINNGEVSKRQLHDCGIIYYPSHPYLLCVMTEGNDLNNLKSTIAQISQMVYKQTDSENNPTN